MLLWWFLLWSVKHCCWYKDWQTSGTTQTNYWQVSVGREAEKGGDLEQGMEQAKMDHSSIGFLHNQIHIHHTSVQGLT